MTATPPAETIVVVEDDPTLQPLLRHFLKGQQYQVLSACTGHEALSLATDHRGPIDLLVTDVVMPQMDGFTLAERLVKAHPETRLLFMTGYPHRSVKVRDALKNSSPAFLLKPFTQARFLEAIREQLDT